MDNKINFSICVDGEYIHNTSSYEDAKNTFLNIKKDIGLKNIETNVVKMYCGFDLLEEYRRDKND